jgi:hypothetical protein
LAEVVRTSFWGWLFSSLHSCCFHAFECCISQSSWSEYSCTCWKEEVHQHVVMKSGDHKCHSHCLSLSPLTPRLLPVPMGVRLTARWWAQEALKRSQYGEPLQRVRIDYPSQLVLQLGCVTNNSASDRSNTPSSF